MVNKLTNQDKLINLASLYCARLPDLECDKMLKKFSKDLNMKIIELGNVVSKFKFLLGEKGDKNCSIKNVRIFQKYCSYSQKELLKVFEKKRKTDSKKISFDKLNEYDYNKMIIKNSKINGKDFTTSSFHILQNRIYYEINNRKQIMEGSIMNLKKGKVKGMIYLSKLNISIPRSDCNESLLEIIYQCQNNNIKLDLELISFENDRIKISI